jgi:hypothetical protein
MSLSDIVQVTITTQTTGITRAGFGTPLIASYHAAFADRVREYGTLSEMVTAWDAVLGAGATVKTPTYKAASAILAQNPKVQKFKVGRRALPFTQTVDLTPNDTTVGLVYTITLEFPDNTTETATYTVVALDAVADIVAGLKLAVDALTGAAYFTSTDNTTKLTIATDTTPGDLVGYSAWNLGLEFEDVTADPGIATDLAAIYVEDTDWYGLVLDSNGHAEIDAAAAWVETKTLLAGFNTADSDVLDSTSTTDVAYGLNNSAYARSYLVFNRDTMAYAGAAMMGSRFPSDPGSSTWAFKTLAGIGADTLLAADRTSMTAKKCNYYETVAGKNITYDGVSASGEYIDVTRLVDWMTARIEENVFLLLSNVPKLAYTDASVEIVKNEVYSVILEAIRKGGIASDPAPVVTGPKVADVSAANKAARILPDIEFEATLAGAIHEVVISGVISL